MENAEHAFAGCTYYDAVLAPSHEWLDIETLTALFSSDTPTYAETLHSPEAARWTESRMKEINSLRNLNTWEIVDIPRDEKVLKFKWVHKIKRPVGMPVVYKSRLTVKGFEQQMGKNFTETFAPVARQTSLRFFLSSSIALGYHVKQLDVESAFPNAPLTTETVFMKAPEELGLPPGKCLHLKKALYGLKQASREWNQHITSWFKSQGFKQCIKDNCIFTRGNGYSQINVLIYVDDILTAGRDKAQIANLLDMIQQQFKIKINELTYFLGMEIEYNNNHGYVTISLENMIIQLLDKYKAYHIHVADRETPMDPKHAKLSKWEHSPVNDEDIGDMAKLPYSNIVGSLIYISITARPDICFPTNKCAQFMSNPGKEHWKAVINILAYLRKYPSFQIVYRRLPITADRNVMSAYIDANHGGCNDTLRSTTGSTIFMNDGPIHWMSKRQPDVSPSGPSSSEYKAIYFGSQDILFLRDLSTEINIPQPGPTIVYEDCQPAIDFSHNPVNMSKMKGMQMQYLEVRQYLEDKIIHLKKISTNVQVADLLTKPLDRTLHHQHSSSLLRNKDSSL
jgi:hypothetical protein